MKRRTVLASIASLAGAGCLANDPGSAPPTESPRPTAESTPTPADAQTPDRTPPPAEPTVAETEFAATERCETPGGASVAVDGDAIAVRGCLRGANGCAVATLEAVLFDAGTGALTVAAASETRGGENRACTQALVDLGYEVRVAFEGGLPSTVRVVHDDADGRSTVARFTPSEAANV